MPLSFQSRARRRTLATGNTARNYRSADGRYIVIELRGPAGHYWLAGRQLATGQLFISRHRKRAAAERACENHRRG